MANVAYEIYLDDLQCDTDHQLELTVSLQTDWTNEDGESLSYMTVGGMATNLTDDLNTMFRVGDEELSVVSQEKLEDSLHTICVLSEQVMELRKHLMDQLKKKLEVN